MSVRRINKSMIWDGMMNSSQNPIIKESISPGEEFITQKGQLYSPGNVLYDSCNGEYHIHKSGHVCACSHNSTIMHPSRFLIELPKDRKNKNIILQSFNLLEEDNA